MTYCSQCGVKAQSTELLTLGQLITGLQKAKPDADVYFDFGNLVPTTLDSYRGYYDQLALGYSHGDWKGQVKASQVLADALSCVGKVFTGYKGGTYIMELDTPIWVANTGESGSTGLVGVDVRHEGRSVYLLTQTEMD